MQVVENDYPAFCHFLASYDDKRGLGGGAQPKLLLSGGGGGGCKDRARGTSANNNNNNLFIGACHGFLYVRVTFLTTSSSRPIAYTSYSTMRKSFWSAMEWYVRCNQTGIQHTV